MKLNRYILRAFLKSKIFFGLVLAITSCGTAAVGFYFYFQVIEKVQKEAVQQSLGTESLMIAGHFRIEFEHLSNHLKEIGEGLLHVPLPPPSSNPIGSAEMEPDILAAALWKKNPPVSAFDLNPDVHRVYLAINSKYPDNNSGWVNQLGGSEAIEKMVFQAAFQGHMVVTFPPVGDLSKGNIALVAVPMGHGPTEEVVVAHVELVRFQNILTRNGALLSSLVDDSGNVLAHPNPYWMGKRQGFTRNALFLDMHSGKNSIKQMTYADELGSQFFGAYARVGIGQLAILTQLPVLEGVAPLIALEKQFHEFGLGCFLLFFCLGYLIAPYMAKLVREESLRFDLHPTETHSDPILEQEHDTDSNIVVNVTDLNPAKEDPVLPVEAPKSATKEPNLENTVVPELRWLVNNGSQMIGPISPLEIAALLFSQELDFECECWEERGGRAAQIQNAGIFIGSVDKQARLWVYDGQMVHGPMLPGFLKTALGHGAIAETSWVCDGSTVSGWKPLSEFVPALFKELEGKSEFPDNKDLEISIAPPTLEPSSGPNTQANSEPTTDSSPITLPVLEEAPQKKVA